MPGLASAHATANERRALPDVRHRRLDFRPQPEKEPLTLELLPCLLPACAASGQEIEHLSMNVYGAQRISTTAGGGHHYYHYDSLGSVTNLTSSAGTKEWTYA
jgi:hypothetical protein